MQVRLENFDNTFEYYNLDNVYSTILLVAPAPDLVVQISQTVNGVNTDHKLVYTDLDAYADAVNRNRLI